MNAGRGRRFLDIVRPYKLKWWLINSRPNKNINCQAPFPEVDLSGAPQFVFLTGFWVVLMLLPKKCWVRPSVRRNVTWEPLKRFETATLMTDGVENKPILRL
jgi:hypothetical protein